MSAGEQKENKQNNKTSVRYNFPVSTKEVKKKKRGVNRVSFRSLKSEWTKCKKLIMGTCLVFLYSFCWPRRGTVRPRHGAPSGSWSTQKSKEGER